MKFIEWLMSFIPYVVDPPKATPGVKFPEGLQWRCPVCRGLIATALKDIHHAEVASPFAWAIHSPRAFWSMGKCCNEMPAMRVADGKCEVFTSTGWVG